MGFEMLLNLFGKQGYQVRGDEDSGTELVYVGYSLPNTAESASNWQIIKITTSANGNVTAINYPQKTLSDGTVTPSSEFDFVWDDRATYTYGPA